MLPIALLLLAQLTDTLAFSGRAQRLHVPIPRIDAEITVDGVLDEAVWSQAARLTEFSQYQPVDGSPGLVLGACDPLWCPGHRDSW